MSDLDGLLRALHAHPGLLARAAQVDHQLEARGVGRRQPLELTARAGPHHCRSAVRTGLAAGAVVQERHGRHAHGPWERQEAVVRYAVVEVAAGHLPRSGLLASLRRHRERVDGHEAVVAHRRLDRRRVAPRRSVRNRVAVAEQGREPQVLRVPQRVDRRVEQLRRDDAPRPGAPVRAHDRLAARAVALRQGIPHGLDRGLAFNLRDQAGDEDEALAVVERDHRPLVVRRAGEAVRLSVIRRRPARAGAASSRTIATGSAEPAAALCGSRRQVLRERSDALHRRCRRLRTTAAPQCHRLLFPRSAVVWYRYYGAAAARSVRTAARGQKPRRCYAFLQGLDLDL